MAGNNDVEDQQDQPQQEQQDQPAVQRTPKVLTVPSNAMSRIKREERERGHKMAMDELNAKARNIGFRDFADMEAAAVRTRARNDRSNKNNQQQTSSQPKNGQQTPRANAPEAPADQQPVSTSNDRAQRQVTRLQDDARRLNQARAKDAKRIKELQDQLRAKEAESELRLAASQAGVREIDFAMSQFDRVTSTMSPEELSAFDESKFFSEDLRRSHPYLYGESTTPVTTGVPNAGPSAPPRQAQPSAPQAGSNGQVDARSLTRSAYEDLLKKMGIRDPANPSIGPG